MALFRRYAADPTPEVREELTRRFLPLARSLAARYERRSESFDDLVQVASLGLIKAIDGFDPSRGKQFSSFAVPTILGELRRHFRDHVWNIRLPRGLQERVMQLDAVVRDLTEEFGREPTVAEVAARMDVLEEEVLEAMEAGQARQTRSLDAPPSGHEETEQTVIEMLGSVDHGYDSVEARASSQAAVLDERELNVLRMRFGRGMSQREIGTRLGVSQMQVSRISRAGLWKLLTVVRGEEQQNGGPPPSARRGGHAPAADEIAA